MQTTALPPSGGRVGGERGAVYHPAGLTRGAGDRGLLSARRRRRVMRATKTHPPFDAPWLFPSEGVRVAVLRTAGGESHVNERILSDPDPCPFVEHFRRRYLRGEIDLEIAEAHTANYRDRAMASSSRTIFDLPRPKPVKSGGPTSVMPSLRQSHG